MKKRKSIIVLLAVLLLFPALLSGCAMDEKDALLPKEEVGAKKNPDWRAPYNRVADKQRETNTVTKFWDGKLLTGIEEVSFEEIGNPSEWFAKAAKRGISVVGIELLDIRNARMGFDSDAMKKAGFKLSAETGNIYPEILREAKRNGIRVIVMLESIEHARTGFLESSDKIKKNEITPKLVKQYISELAKEARKQGMELAVDEEAYPDEYIDAIREATQKNGAEYIHFFEDLKCRPDAFLSEDYSYYPKDAAKNEEDRNYLRRIFEAGSYYGLTGNINIMFGAARGCNVKTGVLTAGGWGFGSKTHQNIALMRAVQNKISMIFFVFGEGRDGTVDESEVEYVNSYNFSTLKKLIEEYGRKSGESNPLANIILNPPPEESEAADYYYNSLLGSAGAVTNAFTAAGYDLVVTSRPVKNAEWYYYLAKGGLYQGDEEYDIPDYIMKLVREGKKIVIQAMAEVPETRNWQEVLEMMGVRGENIINYDENSDADPIPECAESVEGWDCVRYRGYTFEPFEPEKIGAYAAGHGIYRISPEAARQNGAEVLAEGVTDRNLDRTPDEKTALLVRKGNVLFLNGGYVHLAFSSVLANIIAGKRIYNKPTYGYFTNTRNRAAFFSVYDEDMDVNLNVEGKVRIAEFDGEGRKIKTNLKLDGKRLYGKIRKFHLIVADGGGK